MEMGHFCLNLGLGYVCTDMWRIPEAPFLGAGESGEQEMP